MNTGELIERVRLEIFNDLTDAQIVGRFNEHSKRIFRRFKLPEAIERFPTTDEPYYDLPDDCPEDRIRCVVIDDVEYLKVTPEFQDPPAFFCTVFLEKLYINPNPVPDKDAYLYYRARPIMLNVNELDKAPNFPEDYHELYVYDAARWIAGIQRDMDMTNNFQAEYDEIAQIATKDLKKMGLRRAKETIRW